MPRLTCVTSKEEEDRFYGVWSSPANQREGEEEDLDEEEAKEGGSPCPVWQLARKLGLCFDSRRRLLEIKAPIISRVRVLTEGNRHRHGAVRFPGCSRELLCPEDPRCRLLHESSAKVTSLSFVSLFSVGPHVNCHGSARVPGGKTRCSVQTRAFWFSSHVYVICFVVYGFLKFVGQTLLELVRLICMTFL